MSEKYTTQSDICQRVGCRTGLLCALILALLQSAALASTNSDHGYSRLRLLADNDPVSAHYEVQNRLNHLEPDTIEKITEQIDLLNLLARIEYYLALSEQAAQHSLEAETLAKEHGYIPGQIEAKLSLARALITQGKIEESIRASSRSHELLAETDHLALRGEVLFWATVALLRQGRVKESIRLALQAMEEAEKTQDPYALLYAYQALGVDYQQNGFMDRSVEYYQLMYKQARALPSRIHEARALHGMATAALHNHDVDTAERLTHEAIEIYRELQTPFYLNLGLFALASLYSEQQLHAQQVETLDEVILLYERYPNPLGLWYSLMARSEALQHADQLTDAQRDAESALALARDVGQPGYIAQSLRRIASLQNQIQNHSAAYQLAEESIQLAEQDRQHISNRYVSELVERYELESKQREIDTLHQHNAQQASELQLKALQQRWLYTMLLSSLLLLSGTAYFLHQLRKSNRLLRGLAGRLESVREEERKRIARDMHDELGQYLTTIRLEASTLRLLCQQQSSAIVERAQILSTLIDQTLKIARDIAVRLRPAALDMGGLSALEWLAEEFTSRTGITCHTDISETQLKLNEQYLTAIFRIVQESLTNITRYAEASEVWISMTLHKRDLCLVIRDNGKGFNSGDIRADAFGITGMRERAILLGGELVVASKPGKGCSIGFFVRIKREMLSHDQSIAVR
ncbi:tetratricopeptide repeat-containing sensor histidine kinase [Nitrincola sp. MINF-07-Sa-05]|uniref:tetratricopeptide repeat-containing sensor histidine kinase n=1 Tax=Nitrincola salilacus TaxID=3400273 RepID=UPI00391841BA